MSRSNVFREGALYVMATKCSTCIYRPGNPMDLRPGRKDAMEREAVAGGGVIPCHKTLGTRRNAVCRGFFDTQKHEVGLLSAAERMGLVVKQEEEP